MITAGIDGGSRAVKVVIWNRESKRILGTAIGDQGIDHDRAAESLFARALETAGLERSDVGSIVATGYARKLIACADKTVTEITCHAVGARHVLPETRSVIEIGGQDSKFLRLAADGAVRDFSMNDRCAAGTGRFLEVVAERLETSLGELGLLASKSTEPAVISSMCVVFAETEIIGLLAGGVGPADIVAGVQAAMARRVVALAGRNAVAPVVFTGGVALVSGMRRALAGALGQPVTVCPDPQLTGAIGAALLA